MNLKDNEIKVNKLFTEYEDSDLRKLIEVKYGDLIYRHNLIKDYLVSIHFFVLLSIHLQTQYPLEDKEKIDNFVFTNTIDVFLTDIRELSQQDLIFVDVNKRSVETLQKDYDNFQQQIIDYKEEHYDEIYQEISDLKSQIFLLDCMFQVECLETDDNIT